MKRFIVYCFVALAFSGRGQAASFTGLGMMGANAISDDGLVVVGTTSAANGAIEAARWTRSSGMTKLGFLPGSPSSFRRSIANAISADHSVIVGYGTKTASWGSPIWQEARWTETNGWEALGSQELTATSRASDVSADGSVIVGEIQGSNWQEAFRWTQATGLVPLSDLPGGTRNYGANAVSPDGKIIVGAVRTADGQQPFRWTEETGTVGLGDVPGGSFRSSATDISADGRVIVGGATTGSIYYGTGFRWTQETGMVRIDPPPNNHSSFGNSGASAVSGDGSIIVGGPYIWNSLKGTRFLEEVFIHEYGLAQDLAGWRGLSALDISADGRIIVGQGTNPAGIGESWVVDLDDTTPSPPQPPGNYNGEGGVDAADYVVWRNGLGTKYTQADYGVWKANFSTQRLRGIIGTRVSSIELSPTNELQSFVAGGTTYTQDELIQPALTAFAGAGTAPIVVGPGDQFPAPGDRGALLTTDYRMDTGILQPAIGPTAAAITFTQPLINGPGPDLVVFELISSGYPGVFQLQVNSSIGMIFDTSWGNVLSTVEIDAYSRVGGGAPADIGQLENDSYSKTGHTTLRFVGLAIDLDELGVSPLAQVSTIQFGSISDAPSFWPLLFMGINSAPALEGDFNGDGVVDAADYEVWRDGLGTKYTQTDYDLWRAHFGQTVGSGSGTTVVLPKGANPAVPEPTSALLTLLAMVFLACWRLTGTTSLPITWRDSRVCR